MHLKRKQESNQVGMFEYTVKTILQSRNVDIVREMSAIINVDLLSYVNCEIYG